MNSTKSTWNATAKSFAKLGISKQLATLIDEGWDKSLSNKAVVMNVDTIDEARVRLNWQSGRVKVIPA